MKRKICLILVLCFIFAIAACAAPEATTPAEETPAATPEPTPAQEPEEPEEPDEPDEPDADRDPVVVYSRFIVTQDDPWFVALSDAVYEELGIVLEGVGAPTHFGDFMPVVTAMLAAGDSEMDIIHLDELLSISFASAGFLEPINDVMTPEVRAAFNPAVIETNVMFAGDAYLVPVNTNSMLFYVNKRMFEEAGLEYPTTGEEFLEAAIALTGDGVYGYGGAWLAAGPLYNEYIRWIRKYGGHPLDFTTPQARAGLQAMYDFIHVHGVTPSTTLANDLGMLNQKFVDGHYAMVWGWGGLFGIIGDDMGEEFDVAPMPTWETNYTVGAGWHMALNRFSTNQEAAKQVLSFMATDAGQRINVLSFDGTPARLETLTNPEVIGENQLLRILGEYAAAGSIVPRPTPVEVNEISTGVEPIVHMFLMGDITLDEAVEQSQNIIDSALGR